MRGVQAATTVTLSFVLIQINNTLGLRFCWDVRSRSKYRCGFALLRIARLPGGLAKGSGITASATTLLGGRTRAGPDPYGLRGRPGASAHLSHSIKPGGSEWVIVRNIDAAPAEQGASDRLSERSLSAVAPVRPARTWRPPATGPVLDGSGETIVPTSTIERTRVETGGHEKYDRLIAAAQNLPRLKVAVVHPCDEAALGAALEAAALGIIEPILVGPPGKIAAAAAAIGAELAPFRLVEAAHSHDAADKAVALVRAGEAEALMKGSLHTDEVMAAVVRREGGLRTARRVSHCFVMDVPGHATPLIVTDAAVNIAPTLEEKRDITQNAIDLAHALGVDRVRVAIVSAMETVNARVPSTLDAAALCKMADRDQITGAALDGPLALDNAIDLGAARIKKIRSPVAGQANVLVVPNLEAGNMLAKSLTFLARADAAGIVLGARVPIILTSRADSELTRLASCAVASLYAAAQRAARPIPEV
ncbi:phosphate acetyltransferase [Methylobacterium durans]|uniref:phosphate acetyltransferase n=1 Tax=Methylobacterium durans TaxID=2202825 RepID=UPI003AAAF4ED